MAKNPTGNHKGLGTGHSGMTCQNEPPSEKLSSASNCEEKKETIKTKRRLSEETLKSGEELRSQQSKMAKNPTGNHKGLGIGHSGMTCQNEPPSEKQNIYEHIYEQRDKQCKKDKSFCESSMTCQQPVSHDSYHSACKIEETTDEQCISKKVCGQPEDEDQHTATGCVCCLVCPQLICLCCRECGGPDRGIHCLECQEVIIECSCTPQMQTQAQAGSLEFIAKPPDMTNGGRVPNQPKDEMQEGTEQVIPTFLTAEIEREGAEHQSLNELFRALESNENLERKNKLLCKTCRDRELSDQHKDCKHCESNEGYQIKNASKSCDICGQQQETCPGCCEVCRTAQCRCKCSYCHYITTEIREMEMELQPIQKLKQTLETNEILEEEEFNKEWIKLTMLVDCGPSSTIVGIESFKQILDQYTFLTRTGFEYSQSYKHYEFSCGYKTHSLGRVSFSIYVLDKDMQPHPLRICAEVLNQSRIPLLLGSENLTSMGDVFDYEEYTLTITNKEKELCLPVNLESSGHLYLRFYSPNFMLAVHLHQNWDHGRPMGD